MNKAVHDKPSAGELSARISDLRRELGQRVCILAHHYQKDEIVAQADFVGDSLKLSQIAAGQNSQYIVFCGVHFMAESAEILAGENQTVVMPKTSAGCDMADMATADDMAAAIEILQKLDNGKHRVIPVTYVNSTAAVKAVTGQYGGSCCTSSNAGQVVRWAMEQAGESGKIIALPDQHLIRNTAFQLGFTEDDICMFDHEMPEGGIDASTFRRSKFILWPGYCYVHQKFTPKHISAVRKEHPDVKVVVHPECPHEVVELADMAGSTEMMMSAINGSPAGSCWAVGTESTFVGRLAKNNPDKTVLNLNPQKSFCEQMGKTDLVSLKNCLEAILGQKKSAGIIEVPYEEAVNARKALEKMISIV
ncbi:MAG TPA: quinolinate synthase NadA [Phycisphaerae bacterium]|nr:quinolinate synthase NadA [Phycisphaerae bacterium]